MNVVPNVLYEFGRFRIDPDRETLLRDGAPLAVTPKAFEVLLALVRHNREVVAKDELLQAVWPGRVVEEANLTQCIFVLRKLLGDTPDARRYIVTLPGKGYRFAAPVRTLTPVAPDADAASLPVPPGSDAAVAVQTPGPEAAAENTIQPRTRSRVPMPIYAIAGVLVVALVLLASGYFIRRQPARAVGAIPAQSVAVLPFVNESGEADQQYFSDGLSDDLINALSQFDGLKVISHNSAFQFRGSADSSAKIGELLGVSHLLEGTVQRAGDEVRITATLVNASDGSVVWSQRYDRPYQDLFALQDAITQSVASALQAKLLSVPGAVPQSDRPPSGNLAAYNDFLQGRFFGSKSAPADPRKALGFYRRAVALDPHYAAAYARLAYTLVGLGGKVDGAEARAASATALALAPDLSIAHLVRGYVLRQVDGDALGALAEYQRGYALAPGSGGAMDSLGHELAALGQLKAAVALYRKAIVVDPLRTLTYYNLTIALAALGQIGEAEEVAQKGVELRPDGQSVRYAVLTVELLQGRTAAALQWADKARSPFMKLWAQAAAYGIAGDQAKADATLKAFQAKYANGGAYEIAELYALRREPGPMFAWLDRDGAQSAPVATTFLLSDPWLLRYKDDPRFAAFCKRIGLPTTTDGIAMK